MRCHVLTFVAVILSAGPALGQIAPVADHHQHLFQAITARDLVALLDSAHIRRALVLSVAYGYGSPARPLRYANEPASAIFWLSPEHET